MEMSLSEMSDVEEASDMGYQQTLMYGRYSKAGRPINHPRHKTIGNIEHLELRQMGRLVISGPDPGSSG